MCGLDPMPSPFLAELAGAARHASERRMSQQRGHAKAAFLSEINLLQVAQMQFCTRSSRREKGYLEALGALDSVYFKLDCRFLLFHS